MEKFIALNFLLSVHLSISTYGADSWPSMYATDLYQANYHIQQQYVLVAQLLASNACHAAQHVCVYQKMAPATRWLKTAMLERGTNNHAVDW